MPRYKVTTDMPESVKNFFEVVTGQAWVIDINGVMGTITLEFEADDQYDLATQVQEIVEGVSANGYHERIYIPKPERIKASASRALKPIRVPKKHVIMDIPPTTVVSISTSEGVIPVSKVVTDGDTITYTAKTE